MPMYREKRGILGSWGCRPNATQNVQSKRKDVAEPNCVVGVVRVVVAGFWMKQTLMDRGNGGIGGGIASLLLRVLFAFVGFGR